MKIPRTVKTERNTLHPNTAPRCQETAFLTAAAYDTEAVASRRLFVDC
jgi:hypothetical protein